MVPPTTRDPGRPHDVGHKYAATGVAPTQWTTRDLHRGDGPKKRGIPDALRPHRGRALSVCLCPVSGVCPRRAVELCCPCARRSGQPRGWRQSPRRGAGGGLVPLVGGALGRHGEFLVCSWGQRQTVKPPPPWTGTEQRRDRPAPGWCPTGSRCCGWSCRHARRGVGPGGVWGGIGGHRQGP